MDKVDKLKEYANYMENGSEEVARDMGLRIKHTTIISKQKGKLPPCVFVVQDFAEKMLYYSKNKIIGNTAQTILWVFISYMKFGNFIGLNIDTICDIVGKKRSIVHKSMKELKDCNIIKVIEDSQDKRRNLYWVNPESMWKGNALDRIKKIKEVKDKGYTLELFPDYVVDEVINYNNFIPIEPPICLNDIKGRKK